MSERNAQAIPNFEPVTGKELSDLHATCARIAAQGGGLEDIAQDLSRAAHDLEAIGSTIDTFMAGLKR